MVLKACIITIIIGIILTILGVGKDISLKNVNIKPQKIKLGIRIGKITFSIGALVIVLGACGLVFGWC